MTSLSAGAVEGIVNEIVTSDGGDRPVLQVAKFQPVGGANATSHKLWLTDGSRWVYAMAATQVHALLQEGGDFAPGCLVRSSSTVSMTWRAERSSSSLISRSRRAPRSSSARRRATRTAKRYRPTPSRPAVLLLRHLVKKPAPAPARAAPRRPSAGGRAAMPIAELNPYQQSFCLRARVTSKSQMRYWDKPTSKGAIAASRRVEAPSLHSNDSCPSDEAGGGLFFEFERVSDHRD